MGVIVGFLVTATIIFGCIWLLAKMFTGSSESASSAVRATLRLAAKLFYWVFVAGSSIFVFVGFFVTSATSESQGSAALAMFIWALILAVVDVVLWFVVQAVDALLSP